MKCHIGILLVLSISAVVLGKPQISFGEEEETPVAPEEATQPLDNELIQTRLGLLAGYLSKVLIYRDHVDF